jgi:2-dehydro-3-deoxyglucarate aldolase
MTTLKIGHSRTGVAFWIMTDNPTACEIGGLLGYSIAILDMEHGSFDVASASLMTASARGYDLQIYTRVSSPTRVPIQQALDFGSDGVIIPQITGAEHAREATAFAKYPPRGTRGFGGGRTVGFNPIPSDFVAFENSRTLCYAMIETESALEEVEAIAAVETVDGLFIGPNDLSLARRRGEYRADGRDHDDIARIAKAARDADKPWAMPVGSLIDRRYAEANGAAFVALTDDQSALRQGLQIALQDDADEKTASRGGKALVR